MDSDTLISRAVVRNRWSGARNRATTSSVLVWILNHVLWIIHLLGFARLRLSLHLAINVLEVWNGIKQAAMTILSLHLAINILEVWSVKQATMIISTKVVIENGSFLPGILSLPRTAASSTRCGGKVSGNLGGSRNEGSWHLWRKCKHVSRSAVCTDVVLASSKLTALCGDALEVLLGRGIGIAYLKKKSLFADGHTMELFNDILAHITALKSGEEGQLTSIVKSAANELT